MSSLAIDVQGLSKRYRLGRAEQHHESLPARLLHLVKAPVRNFMQLRSLSHFKDEASDDILWALRDISFQVKHGEVVGLIGRNGAGKSTLLKVLSRITAPTSGRARLYGRVSSLLEVGTGFHAELTGRENMYLNGTILGMSKAEIDRKFDEIVAFSGIERFIDTPVKRYSSGMKVRLGFAVAAHLEPEILLVDEVLAVGDVAFQKKCLGKMENVASEGRTVIFVSHHMNMIQALCHRAILLEDGQVSVDADVDTSVRAYLAEAQAAAESTAIRDRVDRAGDDHVRFQSVDFIDPETGVPLDALISGQPVVMRFALHSDRDSALHDVNVGISFYSGDSGAQMTACRSEAVGKSFKLAPGTTVVDCTIDKWPLKGGRYFFNLWASCRGTAVDGVKEAGFIDVEEGDYYGSGVIPARGRPGVLIDFDWRSAETVLTPTP